MIWLYGTWRAGSLAIRPVIGILICIGFAMLPRVALADGQTGDIRPLLVVPDSNEVQILKLDGGSEVMGRITKVEGDTVIFESDLGTLRLLSHKIEKIRTVPRGSIKGGKHWFPNPNQTRLFFSPTARMLKRGEGYFADYYIFFPSISVGLTNNITIGGGLSIFPGLSFGDQIFFLTPKIGFAAGDHLNLAAGALIIQLPNPFNEDDDDLIGEEDPPRLGIIYGVGTWGLPDASVSGGVGFGFIGEHVSDRPVFMLGGEKRLTRSISFVSENLIVPGAEDQVVSYGLRFFGERISFDLAFFNSLDGEIAFPGLPYIDAVIAF